MKLGISDSFFVYHGRNTSGVSPLSESMSYRTLFLDAAAIARHPPAWHDDTNNTKYGRGEESTRGMRDLSDADKTPKANRPEPVHSSLIKCCLRKRQPTCSTCATAVDDNRIVPRHVDTLSPRTHATAIVNSTS